MYYHTPTNFPCSTFTRSGATTADSAHSHQTDCQGGGWYQVVEAPATYCADTCAADGLRWCQHEATHDAPQVSGVAAVSINGDARLDIVSVTEAGEVSWYESAAEAGVQWTQRVISDTCTGTVSAGDCPTLFATAGGVGAANCPTGYTHNANSAAGARHVLVLDIDGDGDQDVATVVDTTNSADLKWYRNVGGPSYMYVFTGPYTIQADLGTGTGYSLAMAAGNVGTDTKDGIAVVTSQDKAIKIFECPSGTDCTDTFSLGRDGDIDNHCAHSGERLVRRYRAWRPGRGRRPRHRFCVPVWRGQWAARIILCAGIRIWVVTRGRSTTTPTPTVLRTRSRQPHRSQQLRPRSGRDCSWR